jgi:hypothetical protein
VNPSTGGDTRSITFGFPAIVPVTLTVKKTVPPGLVVLLAGATFKPHTALAGTIEKGTQGDTAPVTASVTIMEYEPTPAELAGRAPNES